MNKKLLLVIFIAFFFCSVVVVPQISYCQTNPDTLTVTLNTPADSTTSTTLSNVFTYTPIITGSSDYFVSATLYVDGTATTATNSTAILNATANTITYDFVSSETYLWNVQVANSTGSFFATNDFILTVAVPIPTPTPTATPTSTPTATPTATPTSTAIATATPSPQGTPTSTPEPTPTAKVNQGSALDSLLIVGIVAGAVAAVGVTSAFVVVKRRVNEKSLRRFSSRNFQDWVIKRFNGKPSDPASGVDGFTEGGQPLSIKQSDNVSLAEVEDFVNVLVKGRAQKGTIVAFNFDNDAVDGKLKAMDHGIELQMLNIYELVNKRLSDKIKDIATSQVTFEAPLAPLTEDQETETFGKMPNELQKEGLKKPLVFISHSNTKIVDQVKKLLDFLHYDYVMGDKEETPVPIPDNKFGLMKDCDCAIINICAVEQERRYSGIYVLNSNVLTEISAAYLKYNMQVILLVERKIELPSNLKGLKRIEYDNDDLSFTAAMELEKILADFRKI